MAKEATVALKKLHGKFKRGYKKARDAEVKQKGSNLPDDIRDGVCQPAKYAIGVSGDNSDPFVRISYVIVSPEKYSGKVGSKTYYFNENEWKTEEDRLDAFINDLKLQGIDLSEIDDIFDGTTLDEVLGEFCEGGSYQNFHTYSMPDRKTKKPGRTNFEVDGINEDYEPEDAEDPEVEDTEEDKPKPKRGKPKPKDEDEEEDDDATDTEEDEVEEEKPKPRGKKPAPKKPPVKKPADDEEDAEPEEDEDAEAEDETEPEDLPKVGEVYGYKPKGKKVAVKCKIIKLNATKRTCTLRDIKTKVEYPNVKVDDELDLLDDE